MSGNNHKSYTNDVDECCRGGGGHDQEDNNSNNNNNLKTIVTEQLAKIESDRKWVWLLFFLCTTPNILNGLHVSSYVFIGQMPADYWCVIPELLSANWTTDQMRTISSTGTGYGDGCEILNWDYNLFSKMNYSDAIIYTETYAKPSSVSCLKRNGTYHYYKQAEGISVVSEWDLVCENSIWRTTVQVAVSVGKFCIASIFGILSDRYGRKTSFTLSAMLCIVGSIITTASPWYWLFIIGRFILGLSAGFYYAAFVLLTENIGINYRSWMSIAFGMSYPVGMLLLSLSANFIHNWRYLQFSLTVPSFLLFFYCYFIMESPRWLISKGRFLEAYKIVFNKKQIDVDCHLTEKLYKKSKAEPKKNKFSKQSCLIRFQQSFSELRALYGTSKLRRMAFICHFTWFVTSLSYYVTALNGDNLSANNIVYVAGTGGVDLLAFLISIVILRYAGRKYASFALYALSGFCLLILIAIPRDLNSLIVYLTMFGRFGITAVYSIITLHTAEMFPTDIRTSAIGLSSMWSHVGSIAAPYIVDFLGQIAWIIPTTVCGVGVIIAGLLGLTQPETRTRNLKDHVVEEIDANNL